MRHDASLVKRDHAIAGLSEELLRPGEVPKAIEESKVQQETE